MLEIGHEFKKDGKTYCVMNIIDLNLEKYVLFSVEEEGEKLNFEFYKMTENTNGYHFEKVIDDNVNNLLIESIERSNNG